MEEYRIKGLVIVRSYLGKEMVLLEFGIWSIIGIGKFRVGEN